MKEAEGIASSDRVLIVTDNNVETVGGEQESIKIIARNLSADFNLAVLQPGQVSGGAGFVEIGVGARKRIKLLLKKPRELASYVLSVLRYLRRSELKVVHTQAQASLFLIGFSIRLRLIPKRFFFIHTDRGTYSKYSAPVRALFRISFSAVDKLVTTTHRNRELWGAALANSPSAPDFLVIPNAVESDRVGNARSAKEPGKVTIGFAGRYCDWKDWPLAVEISRLVLEDPSTDVEVRMAVGCVDESDRKGAERFLNDAQSVLGSALSATINVPYDQMAGFFRFIDIFVMTAKPGTESFGRTAIEAMSQGCVVLSTDSGGPSEVLDDPGCILAGAEQFASEIRRFALDPELRLEKGRKNQERVRQEYSVENNVEQHRKLYREAIERASG